MNPPLPHENLIASIKQRIEETGLQGDAVLDFQLFCVLSRVAAEDAWNQALDHAAAAVQRPEDKIQIMALRR